MGICDCGSPGQRKRRNVSIKNENNSKQPFPFVNAIYVGKNIKPRNLSRLRNIARKLGVPIFMQKINRHNNGYEYEPYD